MTYYLSLIFIIGLSLGCSSRITKQDSVNPDNYYPRWLKTDSYRTNQTSGITFISGDESGNDEFILIDDIGKLHRLQILQDTLLNFTPIHFSKEVTNYLETFPKIDFEEITYDKFTNQVYVSIEGNGADFIRYNGIYRLEFEGKNIHNNLINGIKKLEINPDEMFVKYVRENIGYEGLAVSEKYLYLGLEGILNEVNSFSGNTLVLVIDKSTLKILKEVYTGDYNIVSICGLYAESDSLVRGIDRNNKTLFSLNFDDSLNITAHKLMKLKTVIPSYNELEYTGSLESITMNKRKNIFLVDDPWHSYFVPDSTILSKLDQLTVKNFKEFVPIIYKLNIE
jgi:hypothetical protein